MSNSSLLHASFGPCLYTDRFLQRRYVQVRRVKKGLFTQSKSSRHNGVCHA